jgi:Protein of unknown function (DUF3253)
MNAPTAITDAAIEKTLLMLCAERSANNATICPSEVARALSPKDWRSLMNDVRTVGLQLAQQGAIEITQRGVWRNPNEEIRGAIRYRLKIPLSRSAGEGAEGG